MQTKPNTALLYGLHPIYSYSRRVVWVNAISSHGNNSGITRRTATIGRRKEMANRIEVNNKNRGEQQTQQWKTCWNGS